jgi:hypothetical protein
VDFDFEGSKVLYARKTTIVIDSSQAKSEAGWEGRGTNPDCENAAADIHGQVLNSPS